MALRASEISRHQAVPLNAFVLSSISTPRPGTCVYRLFINAVSVLCGPFHQTPFDFNSTGALVLFQTSDCLSCRIDMHFLYELLPKDERGGIVTWVPLTVRVSNETPAAYSLNTVAFKQA